MPVAALGTIGYGDPPPEAVAAAPLLVKVMLVTVSPFIRPVVVNSVPANVAEGWNNKHSAVYVEGINRAQGELRETKHHLSVAFQKGYVAKDLFSGLYHRYDECARMLHSLRRSVELSTIR